MPGAPLPDAIAGLVMTKLLLTYGKRFSNGYELQPHEVRAHWAQELAGVSEEGILYALDRLPADYVPNVLQFRALAANRPAGEARMLPAPKASPQVQRASLEALAGLRGAFAPKPVFDLRWAERIVAQPEGKGMYAVKLAHEVLRAHGRIA